VLQTSHLDLLRLVASRTGQHHLVRRSQSKQKDEVQSEMLADHPLARGLNIAILGFGGEHRGHPVESSRDRRLCGPPRLTIHEHVIVRTAGPIQPWPVYFVDNVITTGTTIAACRRPLGWGTGLAYGGCQCGQHAFGVRFGRFMIASWETMSHIDHFPKLQKYIPSWNHGCHRFGFNPTSSKGKHILAALMNCLPSLHGPTTPSQKAAKRVVAMR
jgi:hypothetical protein